MVVHPFNLWKRISLNGDEGFFISLKPIGETLPCGLWFLFHYYGEHHAA